MALRTDVKQHLLSHFGDRLRLPLSPHHSLSRAKATAKERRRDDPNKKLSAHQADIFAEQGIPLPINMTRGLLAELEMLSRIQSSGGLNRDMATALVPAHSGLSIYTGAFGGGAVSRWEKALTRALEPGQALIYVNPAIHASSQRFVPYNPSNHILRLADKEVDSGQIGRDAVALSRLAEHWRMSSYGFQNWCHTIARNNAVRLHSYLPADVDPDHFVAMVWPLGSHQINQLLDHISLGGRASLALPGLRDLRELGVTANWGLEECDRPLLQSLLANTTLMMNQRLFCQEDERFILWEYAAIDTCTRRELAQDFVSIVDFLDDAHKDRYCFQADLARQQGAGIISKAQSTLLENMVQARTPQKSRQSSVASAPRQAFG